MNAPTYATAEFQGNLGADPEIRNGGRKKAVQISIGTNGWNKETREQYPVEFHHVSLFDQQAEYAERELRKGMRVRVKARIRRSKYQDSEGNTRYSTDFIGHDLIIIARPQNTPSQKPQQADRNGRSRQNGPQPRPETVAAVKALIASDDGLRKQLGIPANADGEPW